MPWTLVWFTVTSLPTSTTTTTEAEAEAETSTSTLALVRCADNPLGINIFIFRQNNKRRQWLALSLLLSLSLPNSPLSLSRKFNLYFARCRKVCNAFCLLTFRIRHFCGTSGTGGLWIVLVLVCTATTFDAPHCICLIQKTPALPPARCAASAGQIESQILRVIPNCLAASALELPPHHTSQTLPARFMLI